MPPSGICATVPRNAASATQTTQRGSPRHATRRVPGRERREDPAHGDDAGSRTRSSGGSSARGTASTPQRGQLSQPRPEPVSRTKAPDVTTRPRHDDGADRELQEAPRTTPARAGRAASLTRASLRRPPRRADVGGAAGRPRRRSPRAPTRLSRGKRDEQAAGGLRVVGERLELRRCGAARRAGRRTRGCAGRRRCGRRRRRARARPAARAAGRRRARSGRPSARRSRGRGRAARSR